MTEPLQIFTLDSRQRDRVEQIEKFLLRIVSPRLLRVALREGYDGAEHRLGLELAALASGRARPFEHYLAAIDEATALSDTPSRARLVAIDGFENKYFNRARTAIRRFVPADRRQAVEDAFYAGLTQQPLGPQVVGSVKLLLTRLSALERSAEPGVDQVMTHLAKGGLTPELRTEMAQKVAEAEALEAPAGVAALAGEVAAANLTQAEAFAQLNDWFIDVGDRLRPVFGARDRRSLGLSVGSGDAEDEGAPE